MDQAGIGACERLGPAIPLGHTLRSLMASRVPGASSHHKWFVSETAASSHQGHGHQSDVLDPKKPAAVQCRLLVVSDHGP